MKNALLQLISPMKMADFLSHYSTHTPFVVHHGEGDLAVLRKIPLVESIEALLNIWPSEIQVHLPDLRDEASAIDVTAKDAAKLFGSGMGLLFNDANRFSPLLQEWTEQLRRDLGVSSLTYGRSLIYVTPDGKGTAPHFDQNINFVLQVHGTKKWTLAANDSVTHPMDRHTMGQPVDPEMESYLDSPMAMRMPSETITYELKPGSLLFVPRGVWHMTEAEGDALSLNFTFSPPTWADLFLTALRSRLILSQEWRETADGSEEKLDTLLAELITDLPHWRAENILGATEND